MTQLAVDDQAGGQLDEAEVGVGALLPADQQAAVGAITTAVTVQRSPSCRASSQRTTTSGVRSSVASVVIFTLPGADRRSAEGEYSYRIAAVIASDGKPLHGR